MSQAQTKSHETKPHEAKSHQPNSNNETPDHNPKRDPAPQSNTEKDPADWVTGGEPMTGAQASYMKTLSEVAHEPEAFDESLTKAEASMRIDELKEKTGR